MPSTKGFSLIELMIVIAVISILTVVALPSYRDYVMRGKVPEATTALSGMRAKLEQWYQDNRTYASGGSAAHPCDAGKLPTSSYFNFSCTTLTADGYSIKADGKDEMTGFSYTVNQANEKTTTISGAPASAGWTGSTSCWVTKKGGICT